jgi:hypothetical protein
MFFSQPKSMFIGTALDNSLLKISTMLAIKMLFHFIQLGCL